MINKSGKFHTPSQMPTIGNSTLRGVSEFRRAQLEKDIKKGKFAIAGQSSDEREDGLSVMGNVSASNTGIKKKAVFSSGSSSSGGGWRGSTSTLQQQSELYSPLLLHSNLNLPRDRGTINAWCRAFFALNPYVHNAISLHAAYPISKMTIRCKDKKTEELFSAMAEEMDLMNMCIQIAQEYWTMGECIVRAELDASGRKWKSLNILNPDYVNIRSQVVGGEPVMSLRPDENLKRIVSSNRPGDLAQRQQLDPRVVEHVRRGEDIPLDNFSTSHLARRISPYEIRGTSIIVGAFRALMMYDKIRECKFAQTENMINPLTLIKIGGAEHKPTPDDISVWRDAFEAAQADKDFKLFTHNEVTVERIGAGAGIYDTTNDVQALIKEIYTALFTPLIITDGTDTSYSSGSLSLDILKQRYLTFRNTITAWLRRKIFAPIAMLNDCYDYSKGDGNKYLIVPDIEWNHLNLFDTDSYINALIQLTDVQGPRVPRHSLYHSLGMDYEEVKAKMREEAIDDAILEKEKESLGEMPLNELRALKGTNAVINEIVKKIPGVDAKDNGAESGGELPGVGGGVEMPPAGGMPAPPG